MCKYTLVSILWSALIQYNNIIIYALTFALSLFSMHCFWAFGLVGAKIADVIYSGRVFDSNSAGLIYYGFVSLGLDLVTAVCTDRCRQIEYYLVQTNRISCVVQNIFRLNKKNPATCGDTSFMLPNFGCFFKPSLIF